MSPSLKSINGDQERRDRVGSLAHGLDVLAVLARSPAGLTMSETAAQTGLTRAGARRLLLTLVATGWATQSSRIFRLSPRLLSAAREWLDGQALWQFALDPMRAVAARFNEACSAAVLAEDAVVYVARVPGERIVSVDLHVGTRLPAFCTSMGRVLLSGLEPAVLDDFLRRVPLSARTPRTVTDSAALAAIIRSAATQGYALVDEELELGLRSLAVPIRDRAGRIVAAVNVSTQAARYAPSEMIERILPELRQAARRIEDYVAMQ